MRGHRRAKTDVHRSTPLRSIHRLDERGVSPVIATILLVAITVVLAAVLYVMVSSLFRPVDNGPRALGIALTKSGNGLNWTLTVVTTPVGLAASQVRLTIFAPSGATNVSKTFNSLTYSTDGAVFIGGSTIAPTDRILIDANRYPTRYSVQIEDSISVLYTTILP